MIFLNSPAASYIADENLDADGGSTTRIATARSCSTSAAIGAGD